MSDGHIDPIRDDKDVQEILYGLGGILGTPGQKIVAYKTVVEKTPQ